MPRARLDHVALAVTDPARSASFYQGLLGATVIGRLGRPDITFLRLPESVSAAADIALHRVPPGDPAVADAARLSHVCWEVEDDAVLEDCYQFLADHTAVLTTADFGVGRSVFGVDPDGNVVELQVTDPATTMEQALADGRAAGGTRLKFDRA